MIYKSTEYIVEMDMSLLYIRRTKTNCILRTIVRPGSIRFLDGLHDLRRKWATSGDRVPFARYGNMYIRKFLIGE